MDVSCKAVTPRRSRRAVHRRRPPRAAASDACQKATIEVASGPDKGTTFTEIVQPDQTRRYIAGEGVVAGVRARRPARACGIRSTDVDRGFPLALLAGIFALAVIVVGRMRGVMALVALAVSASRS